MLMNIFSVKIGDEIKVQVNSTMQLTTLNYLVISRARILLYKSFQLNNSESYDFKFKATKEMMPEIQVLIYYIHLSGEVIFDHLTIVLDMPMPNKVCILTDSLKASYSTTYFSWRLSRTRRLINRGTKLLSL